MATKMAAEAKVQLKLLDVFKDFNDIVNVNGSIYMYMYMYTTYNLEELPH